MGNCSSSSEQAEAAAPPAAAEPAPPTAAEPEQAQGANEQAMGEGDSNPLPKHIRSRRRASVSAECGPIGDFRKKVIPKSPEEVSSIKDSISNDSKLGWFFNTLEEEQLEDVLNAFECKEPAEGDAVITQGDEGDNFYLVASGTFKAYVGGNEVFTYEGKGSFGELALLYNAPRAATVKAASAECKLWALDRANFKGIVVSAMREKTMKYESFIQGLALFAPLEAVQRSTIADCLVPQTYEEGASILKQGDELDADAGFYIVESGKADCFRTGEDGERKLVKTLGEGQFFGELALVEKSARQADVVAAGGKLKVVFMGREAFERLMGPVEEILAEAIEEYKKANASGVTA